jgi:SAM-dependent methyltransferase
MHKTAAAFGAAFFRCYADAIEGARILEVGASDVNGALRGCAPLGCRYTGIDLAPGPGVDVVLDDPHRYPFDAAGFDVVVSSSCCEHDPMFWLSFAEMCRVVRPGGFIYLHAPSNGPFHRYPTDNWRFYPDAGLALAAWGRREGHDVRLRESMVGRRRDDVWNDCVMVFAKGEAPRPLRLLAEIFPHSYNIRREEGDAVANYSEATEDMILQAALTEKLAGPSNPRGDGKQTSIETLILALAEREVALGAAEQAAGERDAAAQAQIDALKGALAEHAAQLAEAERAASAAGAAADAQIAALRDEIRERDAALAARAATLAEAGRHSAELAARLAAERETFEKTRADLEARLAEAGRQAVEQQRRMERLSAELGALRGDLAARERALADAIRLAEEVAAELRSAQTELAASDAALAAAKRAGAEMAQERDHIAEQARGLACARDRLAEESARWFDAAILAAAEEIMRPGRRRRPAWLPGGRAMRRDTPSMIARADRARDERRWEHAARFYMEALRRHPDSPAIWVQLGHALKETGKTAAAEFAYRKAADLAPDNFDALFSLSELLKRLDRKAEAIAAYVRARDLAGTGEVREAIANELAALGDRPG